MVSFECSENKYQNIMASEKMFVRASSEENHQKRKTLYLYEALKSTVYVITLRIFGYSSDTFN